MNVMPVRTEEDGQYVCGLPNCGKPLYVAWSHSLPLDDLYDPNNISEALTSSWEVVCENGHQLANSTDGNDYARPFSIEEFLAGTP